jgi:hypothetical protein
MSRADWLRAILSVALFAAGIGWLHAQTPTAPDGGAGVPDFRQLRADGALARTPEALFAVFDADANGCIDDGEWRTRVMAVFFVLDTQGVDPVTGSAGDGRLVRAEAPAVKPDLFEAADISKDGAISAYEFNQASFTRYEAVAKQNPACITFPEFAAYLQTLRTGPG